MTREEAHDFLKSLPGQTPWMSVYFIDDEHGNRDPWPVISIMGELNGEPFCRIDKLLITPLLEQFPDLRRGLLKAVAAKQESKS